MAKVDLIDSHVSSSQCKKAVTALVNHATKVAQKKEETELLPGREENVWLVLSVKKTTPEKKLKPHKIPLAHPIVDPRTTSVCLITKDPQREYKDLLEAQNIKFVSRVVGVTKLKGKFKPFEARRMLLKENGLFLADERVVPLLPGLLGKMFFNAKKQPIPVSLTKKDLKAELEQAVSSTYMHQNQGSCTSIKIGTITQSPAHILDNLKIALPAIAKRIEGGWDNIQSFHIKTNSSTSLPIWSCILGEGENGRWEEPKVDVEAEGAEEDSEEEEVATKKSSAQKGKKRAAEDVTEIPTKKAKKSVEAKAEQSNEASSKKSKKPVEEVSEQASEAPKKKAKKSVDVTSELPSEPKGKKAKKSVDENAEQLSEVPKKKTKKSVDATVVQSSEAKAKKSKKSAETKVEQPIEAPSEEVKKSVDAAEAPVVKKKRADEGMEKKKDKVTKGKIGGSIKESIIGKKSKSRI